MSVLLNMSMGQSVTLHDGTTMSIFKDVNQLAVLIEFYRLNHFINNKNICFCTKQDLLSAIKGQFAPSVANEEILEGKVKRY